MKQSQIVKDRKEQKEQQVRALLDALPKELEKLRDDPVATAEMKAKIAQLRSTAVH